MKYGISREEENQLPNFTSHEEARKYFKDKYGNDFQMTDYYDDCKQKIYFYKLILDRKVFSEIMEELSKGNIIPMTKERIFCSQDIQIMENGEVHIVH